MKTKRILVMFCSLLLVVCFTSAANAAEECNNCNEEPVLHSIADVNVGPHGISFQPKVEYGALVLTVSNPDGSLFSRTFQAGTTPYLEVAGDFIDGSYTYELRVMPLAARKARATQENAGLLPQPSLVQSGSFSILGGKIVTAPTAQEGIARPKDVLHYDDVIITGSLCVGFDCANGESFGYCTVKLKENNLQVCFEDTSVGTFPTNDWKIQINDTTSGGASYFTLWDTDGGRRPFTIEAGAPAHSLYVEDYGRVGLGTSIPYVELHIVDGDSPTIRLDQDGSSGWTAQRWDLCGNETNFFIRDVTNGSKLCFRMQPNTPSNTICTRSTGNVGIGTWSPAYKLEIETTGTAANLAVEQTSGAMGVIVADSSHVFIGAKTNHDFRLIANDSPKITIEPGGDVAVGHTQASYKLQVWNDAQTGYGYSNGGTWNTGSSRAFKENIKDLDGQEAIEAFLQLKPIRFNYKGDQEKEEQLGFIAEDVPEIVATQNRDAISAMDIVTLLTKVVQEQQKTIAELKAKIAEIDKK
jgi:hypothetical protein